MLRPSCEAGLVSSCTVCSYGGVRISFCYFGSGSAAASVPATVVSSPGWLVCSNCCPLVQSRTVLYCIDFLLLIWGRDIGVSGHVGCGVIFAESLLQWLGWGSIGDEGVAFLFLCWFPILDRANGAFLVFSAVPVVASERVRLFPMWVIIPFCTSVRSFPDGLMELYLDIQPPAF